MIYSDFKYSPDAFFLAIPKGNNLASFSHFESEYGLTDEVLCYCSGTLIGQLITNPRQPFYLGVETVFINLLPKLDRQRKYKWPEISKYELAMEKLFLGTNHWSLHCEYLCEQYPILKIENDLAKTLIQFKKAITYSRGNIDECPTFNANYRAG